MLFPAIFASAVLVFADVIDDFVIVRYLSADASTETGLGEDLQHRPGRARRPRSTRWPRCCCWPRCVAILIGYAGYRYFSRGEKRVGLSEFAGV